MLDQKIYRFRYWLRIILSRHPHLFSFIYGNFAKFRHQYIKRDTELLIEGFPRSANTYAYWAFKITNPGVRVAHHSHSQALVALAVKRNIPALVLIRDPRSAITSLIVRHPYITPELAIKSYLDFYSLVAKQLDQIILVEFQSITTDFCVVIRSLNEKFATNFNSEKHDEEFTQRVFSCIDDANASAYGSIRVTHIPRPHESKENLKSKVNLTSIEHQLNKANTLYRTLLRKTGAGENTY